jgi:hypothetical protein
VGHIERQAIDNRKKKDSIQNALHRLALFPQVDLLEMLLAEMIHLASERKQEQN